MISMNLIRFGEPGREAAGLLLEDGTGLDVSSFVRDYDEAFFADGGLFELKVVEGERGFGAASSAFCPTWITDWPPQQDRLYWLELSRSRPGKQNGDSERAVIFFKATPSLVGPNDDLIMPKDARKVDWEVELVVVIGKRGGDIEREDALEYVAGYALHNDYSERVFQLERSGQWVKGKSADTFAPLRPFLATCDEIPDTTHLGMWLKVNGVFRQRSSTSERILDVPTLVSYVSQFIRCCPAISSAPEHRPESA
jgi:2,4-didehydro-3-deoxy-L-rhamnonate hydrolase